LLACPGRTVHHPVSRSAVHREPAPLETPHHVSAFLLILATNHRHQLLPSTSVASLPPTCSPSTPHHGKHPFSPPHSNAADDARLSVSSAQPARWCHAYTLQTPSLHATRHNSPNSGLPTSFRSWRMRQSSRRRGPCGRCISHYRTAQTKTSWRTSQSLRRSYATRSRRAPIRVF